MAKWFRCKGGIWCELNKLDLSHDYMQAAEGVYVVWSGMKDRKVLIVGSGKIGKQLHEVREQLFIKAFFHLGVYVSWVEVGSIKRAGVEAFLNKELEPAFPSKNAGSIPISIELPWED